MVDTSSQTINRKVPILLRFKRMLPRSLFGRTLLIVVTPTILALAMATFVFFDRHWYTVTHRMTYAVAGDMAAIVELIRHSHSPENTAYIVNLASEKMDLFVTFSPKMLLSETQHDTLNPLENMLKRALDDRIKYPYNIDMRAAPEMIAVRIETPEGIYTIQSPERRIYTPTTEVFIIWMISSSLLLSLIALLFMRNQIKPIRRLAEAAEAIGKGREVPWFKPEGAAEVRQAAAALLVMRDRLRRQITQRTAMLAGVSHDLRTPLTRMKLQLALMPDSPEKQEFTTDITDMETMLEAYLAFARGEEAEPVVQVNLSELLAEIVSLTHRQKPHIILNVPEGVSIMVRRHAMKRCLINLISNALRYGKQALVNVALRDHAIDIVIDDDGPGIDVSQREEVFRPFLRLDESRNPTTGGVGLGLTIARDIARYHGGDVVLETSPLGGLRARIWLPI